VAAWVPAGQDQVRLTLTTSRTVATQTIAIHVEGRATIGGQEVVRTAVPADDMMQAFAYQHLVPANDLFVSVAGHAPSKGPAASSEKTSPPKKSTKKSSKANRDEITILSENPVKIPAGGTAQVQVGMPSSATKKRHSVRTERSTGGD